MVVYLLSKTSTNFRKKNRRTTKRSFKDTRCGQALTGMEERLLTYFVNTSLSQCVGMIGFFYFCCFQFSTPNLRLVETSIII